MCEKYSVECYNLVVYIVITGLYKLKFLKPYSVIVPVVGWTGWRMVGPSKREHRCPGLYGSTRCSDCKSFNLRIGVCYNQHEMLWTGIEPKALCLLESWNIKGVRRSSSAFVTPNEHSKTSF